jgi:hypothetical protein
MKKKALLYSIVLATGMSFSGCSDQFLQDMTPYDKYSGDDFRYRIKLRFIYPECILQLFL